MDNGYIRVLVVDDDQQFAQQLTALVRDLCRSLLGQVAAVEMMFTAAEASCVADADFARGGRYDLVILDYNLGGSETGVDILSRFKHHNSVWMAALLTGVDRDKTISPEGRERLRALAARQFFPDRLTVIDKPEDQTLLELKVKQLLWLYEHMAAQRYLFRPITVGSVNPPRRFWQIRYDCGEVMTLPDLAGFATLRQLLTGKPLDWVQAEHVEGRKAPTNRAPRSRTSSTDKFSIDGEAEVRAWAEKRGYKMWGEEIYERCKAEIWSLTQEMIQLLIVKNEEGTLPQHEEALLARLKKDLGRFSGFAELLAERKISKMAEEDEQTDTWVNNDHRVTKAEVLQGGLSIVSTSRSAEVHDKERQKVQNAFRARKKRYLDVLKEFGLVEMAQHLDYTLKVEPGQGWLYSGDKKWMTE